MIEPTDEMVQEFAKAAGMYLSADGAVTAGLAAVLAVVERDYCVSLRPSWAPGPEPVVHLLTAGDEFVHCCGREVADVDREHEWTTLNPHGVTCKGPS